MKTTKRLIVQGQVQGVGFRMSMYYAAQRYGVAGWVRNRRDGTVEAIAQGDVAAVEEFIAWSRKGPGLARVDHVEVTEASGDFAGFEIEDTI